VIFSQEEAHVLDILFLRLHLSGYTNRPYIRIRSAENQVTLQENPLHPSESGINVQCLGNELRDICSLKKLGVDF
jgi:hypothetical protein